MNNFPTPSAPDRSLHAYLWWVTTLAWASTIFYFSTAIYSGPFTGWFLRQILELLHVSVLPATFQVLHHVIRKLAHLSEYAILGLLLYGSFSGGRDFPWRTRTALLCIAIAAGYSLTDELHQLFVPERGPSLVDCGIDTSGSALGMLLLYARHRLFPAKP